MFSRFPRSLAFLALGWLATSAVGQEPGPNQRMAQAIADSLRASPQLRGYSIDITFDGGLAVLTGTVSSRAQKEEAVRLANGTEYGLVAGVWTRDGGRQHRLARRVRAGQVFVNGYGAGGGIELPFGGFGRSGHGREKGFEALYDMSAAKTVVFNHG